MILYINGNYPHHSLHGELVSKLADMGSEITVFVPMSGTDLEGKYRCEHPHVRIIYSDCLQKTDRIFFLSKIHRIAREIEKQVDLKIVDCILTGTVYSDGGVAYLLNKKHGIPFSVAVRETDVTYQMQWRPYLNGFVKRLLSKASKIIFLSPAYKQFLARFKADQSKYTIIPNSVHDDWFQNQNKDRQLHTPLSLIFVGEISARKNVGAIIEVVAELKRRGIPTVFHIVGSGNEENNCKRLAEKLDVKKEVFFHGWQNGREKIKAFYDQADIFVMLSYRETFGTVYIEALSQGLPVIFTKGQGIDGYFEENSVGYGCNPTNILDVADKILMIKEHYIEMSKQCIHESSRFTWNRVADQYHDVISHMRKK